MLFSVNWNDKRLMQIMEIQCMKAYIYICIYMYIYIYIIYIYIYIYIYIVNVIDLSKLLFTYAYTRVYSIHNVACLQ